MKFDVTDVNSGVQDEARERVKRFNVRAGLTRLAENLYLFEDSCCVYLLTSGREAVLIDIGTGDVLDALIELGIERVSDVLLTHHHRDNAQGATLAAKAGARVWVPQCEKELFRSVDAHWQARVLLNSYNNRQDRFSLLEPLEVDVLKDYATYTFGAHTFTILPTPGHTPGSISLITTVGGRTVAFTGDLITAPGKIWSLAATQWSYNGAEGVAASLASLHKLQALKPDKLLPAHGEVMDAPGTAISSTVQNLWALLQARGDNSRLLALRDKPFLVLTPHLLWNRTSTAYGYVLLSASGKALLIDYGYDFMTGFAAGSDRAARRPSLYTLPTLKRDFGVSGIDVVLPTHYHDDHVAGINLLREVEGAALWAAERFADVLEQPTRYDLPCLWYDPIPVDRRLPIDREIHWEEYTLMLHAQPGHTFYAVAVSFLVDGKRVLAIGDQYQEGRKAGWNYVYNNVFHPEDYRASADLYKKLKPELIISGHCEPFWVQAEYFDTLAVQGDTLAKLHEALLPEAYYNTAGPELLARLEPYQSFVQLGKTVVLRATVHNPLAQSVTAELELALPDGFWIESPVQRFELTAHTSTERDFRVTTSAKVQRRARVGLELTLGEKHYGQIAEALVTVTEEAE